MFGKMLNETIRESYFLVLLNRFPFNILYSTFPWVNGNATSCIHILTNHGWELGNLISSIGAAFMAVGVLLLAL